MIGTNDRNFHSFGVQHTLKWEKHSSQYSSRLEMGIRYHGDRVIRLHTQSPYQMISSELIPYGDELETLLHSDTHANALAAYVHEDLQFGSVHLFPSGRLEVVEGSRQDIGSERSPSILRSTLLPGMGALYEIDDWSNIFIGAHRGFSPVSPGQPEDVLPEFSWNYEAGIRYGLDKNHVEIIGFFNDYQNLTGQCTMSGGCDPDNVDRIFNGGKVWIYGLESIAGIQWALTPELSLPINVSYTLTQSQFQTSFTSSFPQFGSVQVQDALPYVATHQGNIQLGLEWKNIQFLSSASYRSEMLNQAGTFDEANIPALLLFDSSLRVSLGKNWHLYFRGNNLTNERSIVSYRPYGARPNAPLQIMGGLKWETAPK